MVLDQAKNLSVYRNLGIGGRYAKAIEWLQNTDLSAIEAGTYEIDGRDVYVMIQEYDTVPWEKQAYESHDNYTDIQYVISGREIMTYTPRDTLVVSVPYNETKDITKYENTVPGVQVLCTAGDYMIFFPADGHKPKAADGEPSFVKKAVVKIKEI